MTETTDHPFQPDWRLSSSAALATHIRIALGRLGIDWSGKLDTDERWERMALQIINNLKNDPISPCEVVEKPRPWDGKGWKSGTRVSMVQATK